MTYVAKDRFDNIISSVAASFITVCQRDPAEAISLTLLTRMSSVRTINLDCKLLPNRQWELRFTRVDKIEAKQCQQKRRRYQTQVAQAQIELAFTTPSELAAWYKRQGIYDDDLIECVHAWSQRFSGLCSEVFASEQPLWAVLNDMHDALASRAAVDKWLDTLVLPNKVEHKCWG